MQTIEITFILLSIDIIYLSNCIFIIICVGENKPGQPVTRSGSDRHPDAVKEETRSQDTSTSAVHNEDDASQCDR